MDFIKIENCTQLRDEDVFWRHLDLKDIEKSTFHFVFVIESFAECEGIAKHANEIGRAEHNLGSTR